MAHKRTKSMLQRIFVSKNQLCCDGQPFTQSIVAPLQCVQTILSSCAKIRTLNPRPPQSTTDIHFVKDVDDPRLPSVQWGNSTPGTMLSLLAGLVRPLVLTPPPSRPRRQGD